MNFLKTKKKYLLITIVGVSILSFSFKSKFFEVAKQIEIYNSLFKELNMYYVDEINPADLTDRVIKNTLKDLDPYTNFYNEQDVEDARIRREGEYSGIGVSVYYIDKGIQIKEIYEGFSADKADLKAGDIITAVDGQSLKNMEREQLSMFLKGAPNSTINVDVLRNGNTIKKVLTREKVEINPVPFYEMINEDTGYITLTRFNDKSSKEVKKAFLDLKSRGMKKLVFDLRSNPGGSLFESIRISNFFLPKGKTIVSTKAKIKQLSNTYRGTEEPLDLEIPIVVLVNGRSASASEIVSGALQDYDRAVILGERSFGKGLVQRQKELTYGTQLKVTISKYYTPSGRCIQELDYANRNLKTGEVPKFSDSGINEFTTQNGRKVYDGGGILPDVKTDYSDKNETTEMFLDSRAIFDFGNKYYYENSVATDTLGFSVSESTYKSFLNFLKKDTTFVTASEALFKKAYKATDNKNITSDYKKILNKLYDEKISEISKNKDVVKNELKSELLKRYFYKNGFYKHSLKNDVTIKKAQALLNDENRYNSILSVK